MLVPPCRRPGNTGRPRKRFIRRGTPAAGVDNDGLPRTASGRGARCTCGRRRPAANRPVRAAASADFRQNAAGDMADRRETVIPPRQARDSARQPNGARRQRAAHQRPSDRAVTERSERAAPVVEYRVANGSADHDTAGRKGDRRSSTPKNLQTVRATRSPHTGQWGQDSPHRWRRHCHPLQAAIPPTLQRQRRYGSIGNAASGSRMMIHAPKQDSPYTIPAAPSESQYPVNRSANCPKTCGDRT